MLTNSKLKELLFSTILSYYFQTTTNLCNRAEPFKFQIGVGQVIKGWEEGVQGMCVGETRKLMVPPELGYGEQGAGDIIPGGATLVFDVELINIEEGPTPVNVFKQIDADGDKALTRDEISSYLKQQVK